MATRDKDTKLIPDPVKLPVVRRGFNLYTEGKIGTTAIARTLDAEAQRRRASKAGPRTRRS
jgi:hypothetical protein